jgi:hypothetical protein
MSGDANPFEYAMGLFSVLIALAVADVATSFHRLVRAREKVRWDPLTLLAALYAICMAVYMWFDIWGVRHFAATRHFFFFLGLVAELFVLFLTAAASLPDDPSEDHDLRAYYARNRRYFWSLLTIFQLGYTAFGLYFSQSETSNIALWKLAALNILMSGPVAISAALIFVKSRTWHYIGIALLFALMYVHYARASIG